MSRKNVDAWWTAVPFVAACQIASALGAWLSGVAKPNPWIDETAKPALWPPFWVFPAVWSAINNPSLGVATWLVWRKRRERQILPALRMFAAELLYSFGFLPLVYRVKQRSFYTAMDAIGLLLAGLTARSYARTSRAAGWAIAPFVAWMAFTTVIKALWWKMEHTRRD